MKNYLAKLRENEEKGFSLVELIIVMAIMAILVGVVASQVIPYMEKSRQSKDQQQLSSLCTDIVSAISQADTDPGDIATDTGTELSAVGNSAGSWGKVLEGLRSADGTTDKSLGDIESDVAGKLKSKLAGTSPKIYVKRSSGVVTVFVGDASGNSVGGKLEVKSE